VKTMKALLQEVRRCHDCYRPHGNDRVGMVIRLAGGE
jgi:ribosomal protein S14